MNILMITLRTDMGGGPKHILDLISVLKSDKIISGDNYFLASPLDEPFGSLLLSKFDQHLPLPHRKFNFVNFIKLYLYIHKHKVDIVHSHGRGAGIYSRLLCLLGCKVGMCRSLSGIN